MSNENELDFNEEFDQHLDVVLARIAGRLQELGLLDQLPSKGIMRIIQEVSLAYWAEDELREEQEEIALSIEDVVIEVEVAEEMPVPGYLYSARTPRGSTIPLAFVSTPDDAMYIQGHKLLIGGDGGSSSKVLSIHRDGSQCRFPCHSCEESDVHVSSVDGEFYTVCLACGSRTQTQPDKFRALAAWLVGQVGKESHAESIFDFSD